MSITEADPATIAACWRRVRAMFARAAESIGAVGRLARLVSLAPARRRAIAGCIGLIETIVRKLLLVEAAALRTAEQSAPRADRGPRFEIVMRPAAPEARRTTAGSTAKAHAFDPAQPHTWRVRFQLAPPRDRRAVAACNAPRIRALWGPSPPPPPSRQTAAVITPAPLRLALRMEALRRVIADPAPHARRLLRALPRLCRRNSEAAISYAIATARPHWVDPGDGRLIVEVMALAMSVAPLFSNTS